MASSFRRESGYWSCLMISMVLSGTVMARGVGAQQEHWAVEVVLVLFAVGAYGLALIAAFMVARAWILHRRSDRTR